MEVYARGCGEGNFDRTEAVDLLGTMAALAFEDEVLSENARRWVEQHASTEGGVKTVSGIQLNFSADCGATLGSMHLSVRANGYVPGM